MGIEQDFPSLKECIWYSDKVTPTKEGKYNAELIPIGEVKRYCFDKQKVREAIEDTCNETQQRIIFDKLGLKGDE